MAKYARKCLRISTQSTTAFVIFCCFLWKERTMKWWNTNYDLCYNYQIDELVQGSTGISGALATEIPGSCTKPSQSRLTVGISRCYLCGQLRSMLFSTARSGCRFQYRSIILAPENIVRTLVVYGIAIITLLLQSPIKKTKTNEYSQANTSGISMKKG